MKLSESPQVQQQILLAAQQQMMLPRHALTDIEHSKETAEQEIDPTSFSQERGAVSQYNAMSAIDPNQQSQQQQQQNEGNEQSQQDAKLFNSTLQLQELRQGRAKTRQPLSE